ncbi:hypothetical protein CHS0354_001564, partial [Potamilus streckersoni]
MKLLISAQRSLNTISNLRSVAPAGRHWKPPSTLITDTELGESRFTDSKEETFLLKTKSCQGTSISRYLSSFIAVKAHLYE